MVWNSLLHENLESYKIGLTPIKSDPCIFHGTLTPGTPLLHLTLYEDGFLSFSIDNKIAHFFETALFQKNWVELHGDTD
jgi:hypothetical protein